MAIEAPPSWRRPPSSPSRRHRPAAAAWGAAAPRALTAPPHRGSPSTKPTSPDAPLPGPSDAVTRTIQLPQAPVTTQPPFDPAAVRTPTVSYAHSLPAP